MISSRSFVLILVLLLFNHQINVSSSFSSLTTPRRSSTSASKGALITTCHSNQLFNRSRNCLFFRLYATEQQESQSPNSKSNGVGKRKVAVQQQVKDDLNVLLKKKIQNVNDAADEQQQQQQQNDDDENDDERIITAERAEIETIIKQMEDVYAQENTNHDGDNDHDNHNDQSFLDLKRFQPALGYYNVSYVQTKQKGDNPVGGKWTRSRIRSRSRKSSSSNNNNDKKKKKKKLFQFFTPKNLFCIRRTMQHLLPTNTTMLGKASVNCTVDDDRKEKDIKNGNDSNNGNGTATYEIRPVVAEAVNVITLDALWNMIHLSIILRGDAVPLTIKERYSSKMKEGPLTNLAVRAFFDPPRIVLGTGKMGTTTTTSTGTRTGGRRSRSLLNLSIGPKSSVVLDTTYVDQDIRIGKGGTSGTRFVFKRCITNGDDEAKEFKKLLLTKPTAKSKLLSILFAVGTAAAIAGTKGGGGLFFGNNNGLIISNTSTKIVSRFISIVASFLFVGVLLSTGGIEQGNEKAMDEKQKP